MPSFEINKTDKDIVNILPKYENRFIVKKDNNIAKLYFDYDDKTRLEIKSTNYAYQSSLPLTSQSEISIDYISLINDDNRKITINDIITGSFIVDGTNIGIIKNINKDENKITIELIYSTQKVLWGSF